MNIKFLLFSFLSPLFWLKYNKSSKTFPQVLSSSDSLRSIIESKKSLARFGDGEFNIVIGGEIGFQKQNEALAHRLQEILKSPSESCLIGIPNVFNGLIQFRRNGKYFWLYKIVRNWSKWENLFLNDYIYTDALISRFFLDIKDKTQSKEILDLWRTLWKNKKVVIIEGDGTKMGVGNDLFRDSLEIRRIICPSKNAFDKYSEIIDEALKIDKDNLILIALGPTASILAYDLSKYGYQAIDTGHLDLEYNWMKMNATNKEAIAGRAINELNIEESVNCRDNVYLSQIIADLR